MRKTLERELKLQAEDGFELPDLGGEPLEPRVFVSTYHDTADFRLARSGATLRYRVEHGRGLWQLKLPRATGRLELETDGGPADPPVEVMRLLPALTRGHELAPVARLRTRRSGVSVRDDSSVAEVVLDSVSVREGQRVTRVWEGLEVELLEGDGSMLDRIGKSLRSAGAGTPEARPKVVQALGLDVAARAPKRSRAARSRRSVRCSGASSSGCSSTTPGYASATTLRICTSCASPRGGSARSCAPPGRCSFPNGPASCATSWAGWGGRSGRCATSMC